jgi:hypothetical protein
VNRSKSDALFKKSAQKLEEALKAAGVNLEVITNPEKPRKGSFEVQDDKGNKYVSLQVKHSLTFSCFEARFVASFVSGILTC